MSKRLSNTKRRKEAVTSAERNDTPSYMITPRTTDTELKAIAGKLEKDAENLKVRFEDRKRNSKEELTNLSIETKFPGQSDYYKNVVYGGR